MICHAASPSLIIDCPRASRASQREKIDRDTRTPNQWRVEITGFTIFYLCYLRKDVAVPKKAPRRGEPP